MSILKLSAKLDRTDSGTSWGFRMAGGKDFGTPLVLQKVVPGSLASKCGLQEGDSITRICGAPTDQLRHKEAQQRIIDAGNSLELTLERGGGGGGHYDGSSGYAPSPAFSQQSYGSTPKPYTSYSNNSVTSITSQTASMNLGSPTFGGAADTVPWARSGPASPPAYSGASPRNVGGAGGGLGGGAPPGPWRPQIPTGPRTMKVGKAGEAKTLPATMGSARIPICSSCGTAIRGPFISALDKTWCPDHFTCANPQCRTPLINIGFVEEEGQLFCEKDYEQYFAPRCGKCGRAIVGEVVNALKNTFHMGCFLCCHCHQPIGTGSFHNEDGKIYCLKDWGAMFQTKCYGCQFPIEPGDRWVEALSNNWHSECFNCSTCQVSLEGQSFVAKNGKPYCKKHGAGGRY